MSADLYLIATPNDPAWHARFALLNMDDDVADMSTAGGEQDAGGGGSAGGQVGSRQELTWPQREALYVELGFEDLPRVWIGSVSWAKGFVPEPVDRITQVVGQGRLLTAGVAGEVLAAMNLPNTSMYGRTRITRVTNPATIAWYRRVSRTARGRAMFGRFSEPGFVTSRTGGLEKRRVVKGWLRENVGAWVIAESE